MSQKLRQACAAGKFTEVARLLNAGADVNEVGPSSGKGPLHRATEGGYVDIINLLLDNGANLKCQDNDGNTPLHLICASTADHDDAKLAEIIALLLYKPFELFRKEQPKHDFSAWGPKEMLDLAQDLFQANKGGKAPLTLFTEAIRAPDDKPISYYLLTDATTKQKSPYPRVMLFAKPCVHSTDTAGGAKLKPDV